jgi:MoxR-like ATPase
MREQPDRKHLEGLTPVMTVGEIVQLQERVTQVRIDDAILDYVLELVEATRRHEAVEVGVSPRGSVAMICAAQASAMIADRDYVVPDDIKALVIPVFAHRLVHRSFSQNGQFENSEQILKQIVEQIPIPG